MSKILFVLKELYKTTWLLVFLSWSNLGVWMPLYLSGRRVLSDAVIKLKGKHYFHRIACKCYMHLILSAVREQRGVGAYLGFAFVGRKVARSLSLWCVVLFAIIYRQNVREKVHSINTPQQILASPQSIRHSFGFSQRTKSSPHCAF